jgi:anti-sigma factor RsiW
MDCMSVRRQIHAYLDQELDLPSMMVIDRHLTSCPGCQAVLEQLSTLQSGLREHAVRHGAPRGLAERIRAQVGAGAVRSRAEAQAPVRRMPWLRQWFQLGAAVAASAVVTWTATTLYYASAEDSLVTEQIFASHTRSVLTERLFDVASSDQHTVKPWLSSRLDFSPPVADLASAGFPLIGGRLDYVNGRRVAVLVYRHRQHWIDLFVWPETGPGVPKAREQAKNGFNVLRWNDSGLAFWAVSDVTGADLKQFAEAYASAK